VAAGAGMAAAGRAAISTAQSSANNPSLNLFVRAAIAFIFHVLNIGFPLKSQLWQAGTFLTRNDLFYLHPSLQGWLSLSDYEEFSTVFNALSTAARRSTGVRLLQFDSYALGRTFNIFAGAVKVNSKPEA